MIQHPLLQGHQTPSDPPLPQLPKHHRAGHSVVSELLRRLLGVLVRIARSLGPGEGLVDAEDEEEVDPVGLREGEEGVALVGDHIEVALAEFGDAGGDAD